MSYIGNAKTPLLLASNVRDDLIPSSDGTQSVFNLSQEVPGGEAINVCVVRRKYLTDVLVENTDLIQFSKLSDTESQIVIEDNYLASAFSVISPNSSIGLESSNKPDGDTLVVNDDTTISLRVKSVSCIRDRFTITLQGTVDDQKYVSLGAVVTKVERKYYGPWEILDPGTQYEIVSTTGYTNRQIEIKDGAPQPFDMLYVLHRGEATYNFVPSPYSVGPDQLAPNLRNFAVDAATYNTTGQKDLTLSQLAPSASTLLVTVNGVVQVSTNENSSTGTWTLNEATGTTQTITLKSSLFTNAVASPVAVRVLHLSFSTVSRRATFVVGQDPKAILSNSVTTNSLIQSAVTTEKIADNSIVGSKIRLLKTDALRFQTSSTTEVGVVKLDQTNTDTQIVSGSSSSAVQIKPGSTTYTFSSTSVTPSNTNVSLGTSANKFKNLFVESANANSIHVRDITVTGNINITGTIDNTDVSDLKASVDALAVKIDDVIKNMIPIGTIVPTGTKTPPITSTYGEWILCNGQSLKKAQYAELFDALGGQSQVDAGWPWGACTADEFSIPDLRRRMPLGKSTADSLGANEGIVAESSRSLTHTHSGANHTHTMTHEHTVPGHKHTVVSTASGSLNITLSGTHSTSISHSHNQGTIETNKTSLDHSHKLTHSHTERSTANNDGGDDHTHTGSTGGGTAHRHKLETSQVAVGSGGYKYIVLGGSTVTDQYMSTENSHTHNFTTNAGKITHTHKFSIPSQTDETGGCIVSGVANTLNHSHSFSLSSASLDKTVSDSTGEHTHGPTNFSGFIGSSVDSTEGNSNFSTAGQSTSQTGSADYGSNTTGSATLPYIIVNYMIKAK